MPSQQKREKLRKRKASFAEGEEGDNTALRSGKGKKRGCRHKGEGISLKKRRRWGKTPVKREIKTGRKKERGSGHLIYWKEKRGVKIETCTTLHALWGRETRRLFGN